MSALHWAAQAGHLDATKLLYQCSAFLNLMEFTEERLTPLDHAMLNERDEVALYLMEQGTNNLFLNSNRSVVEWIERLLLKRYTLVRFPVGSNQRLQKLVFTASLLVVQPIKGQCEISNVCGRQVAA